MLHIINKSPFSSHVFELAANLIKNTDTVILIDDGCYALQGPHDLCSELISQGVNVKAIKEHCETRGIDCSKDYLINMPDFVDISFELEKNISWY